MDWARAKNILIIAFILLNIFLLYNLFSEEFVFTGSRLSANDLDQLVKFLKTAGIEVSAKDIPQSPAKMQVLKVGYQLIDTDSLLKKVFGENKNYQQKGQLYWNGNTTLKIDNSIKVTILDKIDVSGLSEGNIYSFCDRLLDRYGLNEKDKSVSAFYKSDDGYVVEYQNNYQDHFLDISYIRIKIKKSGELQLEKLWLKPMGFSNLKRDIIGAADALLRLASYKEKAEPLKVTAVESGWYFSWESTDIGQAVPVWRIKTDGGEVYYINAFTGELEK